MSFTDTPDFDLDARDKRDTTVPRFYTEAVHNKAASEREGRPIYDDVEMVEILIPGDRRTTVVQYVNDEVKRRYRREYEAFTQNRDAPVDGTPIDQLPGITRAMVEELRYFHVHSIETLARLSDEQMGKLGMAGRSLRDKAIRWVERTEGAAAEEKLAAENRQLRENMGLLEKQMADMQAQNAKFAAQLEALAPKA